MLSMPRTALLDTHGYAHRIPISTRVLCVYASKLSSHARHVVEACQACKRLTAADRSRASDEALSDVPGLILTNHLRSPLLLVVVVV